MRVAGAEYVIEIKHQGKPKLQFGNAQMGPLIISKRAATDSLLMPDVR